MGTSELFLLAMIAINALPFLTWRALRLDRIMPLVVIQIVGGILMGPGVLGAAFPNAFHLVFGPSTIAALNGIAWWAVMAFVWVAGVELDLKGVWAHRRETGLTAGLALGLPLILGACAALVLLQFAGWIGPNASPWQFVVGIGMACAVTALPILVLFLDEFNLLHQPLGQRILRYASIDDIAIWGVLAIILVDWERIGRQLAFLILFAVASLLVRIILRRLAERDRWFASMIWLAAAGFAADWSGLHFMVGAFLSGFVVDRSWFRTDRLDAFRHALLVTVMPVFFLSTGLRTEWAAGGAAVVAAAVLLLAASVVGKLAGVSVAGRILGWRRDEAMVVGWLLQTKALIMIIFVNILLDKGLITGAGFTALLLMAVGSTMLTSPVVTHLLRRLGQPPGTNDHRPFQPKPELAAATIEGCNPWTI